MILNYTPVDDVVDYDFSGLCWITVLTAINFGLICSPFWHYDHVQYVFLFFALS